MQIDKKRRLSWASCYNTRDIGGFRRDDGRETRWRSMIRSDNLSRLTEEGRAALVEHGVRTIIDVRAPSELLIDPPPFAEPDPQTGVAYLNLPFFTNAELAASPVNDAPTVAESYTLMLHHFAPRVAAIMRGIACAAEGGVVVHCHSGKDRTGLIVALLLSLIGVPDDVIAADYALSSVYLRPATDAWIASGVGDRAERETQVAKYATRPETMLRVLKHLTGLYGGAEGFLLESGVKPEDLARLKMRLLSTTL